MPGFFLFVKLAVRIKKFISSPKLEVIAELPTEESLTVGETEQELDAISNTTSKKKKVILQMVIKF